MTRTVSRTYPLPPGDLVEAMISDDYQRTRSERLGGTAVPTVTKEGGVVTVRFPRRLPLDDVPGPLRALAGKGELVQVERWDAIAPERCTGSFTTESPMPGTVTGRYDVTTAAAGATFTVVVTASIKVPLVGGRIANEVEGHVVDLVEAEMDLAEEYLGAR